MNGALGIGMNINENGSIPVCLSSYNKELCNKKIIEIGAGYYHSMILSEDNKLYTFGYNGCYNSCIADINDNNYRPTKKFYVPHFVNIKKYFLNNNKLKKQYGKNINLYPPQLVQIFGGFYSSVLMLKH